MIAQGDSVFGISVFTQSPNGIIKQVANETVSILSIPKYSYIFIHGSYNNYFESGGIEYVSRSITPPNTGVQTLVAPPVIPPEVMFYVYDDFEIEFN